MVTWPLARLWTDRCTVFVLRPCRREDGSTGHREEALLADLPCKLSFYEQNVSANGAVQNDGVSSRTRQVIKLFLAPEHEIPPGSKIVITRGGRATAYARSGVPETFPHHQEILLELWQKWA